MGWREMDPYPACWRWPESQVALQVVGETSAQAVGRYRVALEAWQAGRCAICGGRPGRDKWGYSLVDDHDHTSMLVRGLLCRSCNTAEGCSQGRIFRAYRKRHPTVLLGMTIPYRGGCLVPSCACDGGIRKGWLLEATESGVVDPSDLGTLTDLLWRNDAENCFTTGGHACCEHGPVTAWPPGPEWCPNCERSGYTDDGNALCGFCGGVGRLPVATDAVMAEIQASATEIETVLRRLVPAFQSFPGRVPILEVGLAHRYLAMAARALRSVSVQSCEYESEGAAGRRL
ncbi:endonuclease domain-containing protein [Paractinoplanes pyxinae]|uniref:endonuclease domain-containing protein n=1 Tax=Paractinoplanes pyxinae TaxID=2997416 RepID=UPI0034DB15FF